MIVPTSVCELEWMYACLCLCVCSRDSRPTIIFAYSKIRGYTFQSHFNPLPFSRKKSIAHPHTSLYIYIYIDTYNMTHIQRVIWLGAHRIAKPMSNYKSKVVVKIGDFLSPFAHYFITTHSVSCYFFPSILSFFLSLWVRYVRYLWTNNNANRRRRREREGQK